MEISFGNNGYGKQFSSIRHNITIDSRANGIRLARTDPTAGGLNFTDGSILIEQNTIINPIEDGILNKEGTYLARGSIVRKYEYYYEY